MNLANYLLIDGILRPDALKQLYARGEALLIKPLYLGTRWGQINDRGPILVSADQDTGLFQEWHAAPDQHFDSAAFYSPEPMATVRTHLERFLCPQDHLGQSSLFRFADPVVLHFWLSSYSTDALDRILGPIDQVWVRQPLHSWVPQATTSLTLFKRQQPPQPWQQRFAVLGEPQLSALEAAFRWMLIERLYAWLNKRNDSTFSTMDGDEIGDWLEQAMQSAGDWGLVSEYAIATWLELCQDWGLNFTQQTGGPYSQWLTEHPGHSALAPELRLEALDDFRFHTAREAAHE